MPVFSSVTNLYQSVHLNGHTVLAVRGVSPFPHLQTVRLVTCLNAHRQTASVTTRWSQAAGESKTETIKRALLERRERVGLGLARGNREKQVLEFLREEVWPLVPEGEMGRCWSKGEEEAVLGYGEQGI